ncbi:MAG: methyltransferase domain-containing protein [Pseudomonadota bacterium]
MQVARARLQANFSKAALAYDAQADFQHNETRRVLDAALMILPEAATVVDIGCGTGSFAALAQARRPGWKVIGVDLSHGMCRAAAVRCAVAQGDAARLPLADGSAQAAVSSLCYQWVGDVAGAFTELARVLAPGARAVIATLGPQTLGELRTVATQAALPLGLLEMRGLEAYTAAAQAAGLEVTLAEQRLALGHYADVPALLNSMRSIGAGNNFATEKRGLTGAKRWQAMTHAYESLRTDAGLPATWEHLFLVLRKPL